jgi:hypothetical protein
MTVERRVSHDVVISDVRVQATGRGILAAIIGTQRNSAQGDFI